MCWRLRPDTTNAIFLPTAHIQWCHDPAYRTTIGTELKSAGSGGNKAILIGAGVVGAAAIGGGAVCGGIMYNGTGGVIMC